MNFGGWLGKEGWAGSMWMDALISNWLRGGDVLEMDDGGLINHQLLVWA